MKLTPWPFALALCLPQAVCAADATDASEDREELLALLEEQTAIATRTRMNADYVPGMVTVLHGEALEARGARTVWEALALVPGMETAIEKTGRRKVLVRGLGNTWASGNVKILLNDVSMNSAEQGLTDPVFNIPVEQVDRIEVIRGPGSAIYGEFAYMGVINVITRADKARAFVFGGSFDTAGAGATLLLSPPESAITASLNLAAWRTSGADVETGPDLLHLTGSAALSNAPGPANEELDAATAVFKLGYDRFALTAQWSQDGLGDHFGINSFLPPHRDRVVERNRHRTLDMRQELPLTPSLVAGVQLGWKDVERRRDDLFVAPPMDPGGEEVYLDSCYLETATTLATDLTWRAGEKHTVLMAGSISTVRVDENRLGFNPPISDPVVFSPAGTTREITSVTLQDEYRHSDLFTLTAGVRYDGYSDVGINYSPRIAGVWRLDDSHIVKAQYAQAFRPPSLYEFASARFAGGELLDPAVIRTSEVGYIFKGYTAETRATAFYSKLDDLVVLVQNQETPGAFANEGATTWGIELEQNWRPTRKLTLDGNVSYVQTRDEVTDQPFPGAARWIANAGVGYDLGPVLAALQVHHVSGFERQVEDPRDRLDGYTTVDFTVTFANRLANGVDLRLGVKNVLDAEVRYPAPATGDDTLVLPTYPDDYPRAGRTWWTQLSFRY